MKMQYKTNSKFWIFILIAAVIVAAAIFGCTSSAVAYADTDAQTVFPSNGYIQTESPSLIAANNDYLLIYDDAQKRLYVRSNTDLGNYDYVLNFTNVDKLLAVGTKAFLVADNKYFSLDLENKDSVPQEITLATPNNISFLSTDGEYLYAKSSSGFISIYDDSFQIALGQDNAWNDALTGHSVVLGSADTLYIFSTQYGLPVYTVLDLVTNETTEQNILYGISAANLGSTVFFALTGGEIVCLDKNTGTAIISTEIQPDAFTAYGRNLFTIENNAVNFYTLSQDMTELELVTSLKMTGNDSTHFDTPVDIEKLANKFAVADSKNNRIAYFDGNDNELSTFDLETSPIALAHDGSILYIACEDKILKLNSVYIEQRYDLVGVKDLLYLDKLYALTNDGIYVIFSDEFEMFFEIQNAVSLACAEDGSNVFVATENEILVIDASGNKLPTSLVGNFAGIKDIAVDYFGNIIVAYESKVEVFANNLSSMSFVSTHPLEGELRATLTSCKLVGNELYFTTAESYVGKIALNVQTKATYPTNNIPTDIYTHAYSYAKAINPSATYFLPTSQRNESIKVANGNVLIVYEYDDAPNDYFLAFDGVNLFYIPTNAFENVETEVLSGEYVATKQTVLFVAPNRGSAQNVVIEEDTHVIFKRTTAGFDGGKWVVVEYENNEYFATASDFAEYVAPTPEHKAKYGRAKSNRVGGIVNVYQSASTDSAVILEIADGAKVEILETLDDFYKVSVNGTVGYMRKDDVQLGGLTTVQIVSIILAILVLLAGSTVFAAIYFTKKKQAENE